MSIDLTKSAKVKLATGAVAALVLAVAAGTSGALAVRALDGDDERPRRSFPGWFEDRGFEREELPRLDREREYRWPGHFGSLQAATSYLDLSEDELRERLRAGETLAEIARDEAKSVAGLVEAMVDDVSERVDEAVVDDRLTHEQADAIKDGLEERMTDLVNGEPWVRPFFQPPGIGPDFEPRRYPRSTG